MAQMAAISTKVNPQASPLDPGPTVRLPPGAALVVGPAGKVLVERRPFPVPDLEPGSLRGRCLDEIGPPALGQGLCRLWQSFRRDGTLHVSEMGIGLESQGPVVYYSLSLGAVAHPEFPDLCVITVRDVRRHSDEVQELLTVIQALREQCLQWEVTTRTTAHDVRSSLSAMTGFLQLSLLEAAKLPAGVQENLNQALQIGRRLYGVLGDLQHDRTPPSPVSEQVAIAALGQRLFQALYATYPTERFTWHVESTDQVVRVPLSVTWRVLWNVLTNAVKYRREDRPLHIGLRAWVEAAAVHLEVRDSGKGIPAGAEEEVFEYGRRHSSAIEVEGSGLGLFSARQHLEGLGGKIWIEPCADGTRVRISLPLQEEPAQTPAGDPGDGATPGSSSTPEKPSTPAIP